MIADNEREDALRAYYEHTTHTVWRYLLKPNPWMSPEASYVLGAPREGQGYSTFEEYIPLIALFYVAAIDDSPAQAPTDTSVSVEERYQLFLQEVALIGRAHNWDSSRAVERDGEYVEEEYDDEQGDKPSCYSGVNRRLMQALLYHPLQEKSLTAEKVNAEKREFIRNVMLKKFEQASKEDLEKVLSEFDALCIGEPADTEYFKQFDITEEEITAFTEEMSSPDKYGSAWTIAHSARLMDELAPKDSSSHFLDYVCFAELHDLLLKVIEKKTQQSSVVTSPVRHLRRAASAPDISVPGPESEEMAEKTRRMSFSSQS